jgi:hypothetical protein
MSQHNLGDSENLVLELDEAALSDVRVLIVLIENGRFARELHSAQEVSPLAQKCSRFH